ncbi:MAG: protein sorting system archaetidylserine decarboxylase [Haloferacaceae archaeon]
MTRPLVPGLAPGAGRSAAPLFAAAVLALSVAPPLAPLLALAGWAVLLFYRDPERAVPAGGVLAPADGVVSVVREEGDRVRVGTYMNVLNVHVTRAPVAGAVASADHHDGGHLPAFSKDSERNERVELDLGAAEVTLIAGAVARRITPYVDVGDDVDRGDRIGHIAFGSRVDVLLPPEIDRDDLYVEEGDTMLAGETPLAPPQ